MFEKKELKLKHNQGDKTQYIILEEERRQQKNRIKKKNVRLGQIAIAETVSLSLRPLSLITPPIPRGKTILTKKAESQQFVPRTIICWTVTEQMFNI